MLQRTISRVVTATGIGLHSGKKIKLTLRPAPADSGIQFQRSDRAESKPYKASVESVSGTTLSTSLGEGDDCIHTVEHLLAVIYGMGISNVLCQVEGPEVPIMDGSGATFIYLLQEAGIQVQEKMKNFLVVLNKFEVSDGDAWIKVRPAHKLTIDSTIDFNHPAIGRQNRSFEFNCQSFINDLARARTFGMLRDLEGLRKRGLALGAGMENVVGLDQYKVLNPEGLRYTDEFVRHKILDTIGDISLLGHHLLAKITTYKSGHSLHNKLCKEILCRPELFTVVSANELLPETRESYHLPLAMIRSNC